MASALSAVSSIRDVDIELKQPPDSLLHEATVRSALTPSPFIDSPEPPLDCGWRAWITVAGSFLALFCSFGQINAFGTFQEYYATHQLSHLPASTISWIGSMQLWVFFFSVCPLS